MIKSSAPLDETIASPDRALVEQYAKSDTYSSTLETLASSQSQSGAPLPGSATLNGRYTTLPRIEMNGQTPQLIQEMKERYQSVKLLGKGGEGEVNLVQDLDIARSIAMKRLLPGRSSPQTLYRFAQEVRTVGQLEHPNIIPIHDVGRDETGELYFTMKYVNGETLESIIKKLQAGDPAYHQKFTFESRVEIFLGILNAISFAHAKGIIHRDIKPANIMVGPYGEVVVMDWGIAKQLKGAQPELTSSEAELDPSQSTELFTTHQGALVGTPAYMSPEQAKGQIKELDPRSDIYSLCALFFELLTLRHYLQGKKTVRAMLMGVVSENPPAAYSIDNPHQSSVPAELAHFLRKGMEKDPSKRFQSVQEMITTLQNNREGKIAIQCSSTFVKRATSEVSRWVDRHPTANFVLLMLLCVALLASGVSLFV